MSAELSDGKIVAEGNLAVWECEGGFSADEVMIDDDSISSLIARLFGLEKYRDGAIGDQKLGRVRLTLEKLD